MRDVSPAAPMDGFTAFLESPPPGPGFACDHLRSFMNNAALHRSRCLNRCESYTARMYQSKSTLLTVLWKRSASTRRLIA